VSPDIAKIILGTLIMLPNFLEIVDLSEADFLDERKKKTFRIIANFWEEKRPKEIDPFLLAERLGGDDALTFVSELTTGLQHDSPEMFIGRVAAIRESITVRCLAGCLQKELAVELKTGALMDLTEILQYVDELRRLRQPKGIDINTILKSGQELGAIDLNVEWVLDKLIPERAITVLYGPGGIGKTWLGLMIAKAASEGADIFSLPTKKRPVVYLDFENPLPVLIERIRQINMPEVLFWHLGFEIPPPRIDVDDWKFYKSLPRESLIIIDSLRSSQTGDENSSRDMAIILGRLKELREQGRTILLYHHTSKVDERTFRGSMAITDLADHVLAMHRVKPTTFEELGDDIEPDPDAMYYLGAGKKTRYERHHVFLQFSAQAGFVLAKDPDLDAMTALAEFMRSKAQAVSQIELTTFAKTELGIARKKALRLLAKGERVNRWTSFKDRTHDNRTLYEAN